MSHTEKHEAYSLLRSSPEEDHNERLLDVPQHKYRLQKASAYANIFLLLLNLTAGVILLKMHSNLLSKPHLIDCKLCKEAPIIKQVAI